MNLNILLGLAKKVVVYFWESAEVKKFVVELLQKYVASTDNDVDDILVGAVKEKLLKNVK